MVQGETPLPAGAGAGTTTTADLVLGPREPDREIADDVDPIGDEAEERNAEISDLKRRVIWCVVLSAPVVFAVMAVEVFNAGWVPSILMNHWLQLALILPVMFYAGWPIHRTWRLALSHRTADMNSLITIAAFGYSLVVTLAPRALPSDVRQVYDQAVGVIITLILLARLLETKAKPGPGRLFAA